MKLTMIGILLAAITSYGQGGQKITHLECGYGSTGLVLQDLRNLRMDGTLNHNYSSAQISCGLGANRVLDNVVTVRCYGSWDWDFDRKTGKVVDSLAWVEIKNDGQKITVRSQTNHSYGQKIINMDCKIHETFQPERGYP